ncbi:MAG: helix-turn-helix domain-containing protein [Thermoguttaceae bacterium]
MVKRTITIVALPLPSVNCPGVGHPTPRPRTAGQASRGTDPIRPLTLAGVERDHILGALRETRWVVGGPKGAAARLGMKRSMLHLKMKKLGISRPQ